MKSSCGQMAVVPRAQTLIKVGNGKLIIFKKTTTFESTTKGEKLMVILRFMLYICEVLEKPG